MLENTILNIHALENYDDIIKDQLLNMYNTLVQDIQEFGYTENIHHIYRTLCYYDIIMTENDVMVYKRDNVINKVLEEEEK